MLLTDFFMTDANQPADLRQHALMQWLEQCAGKADRGCEPIASGASTRRYFRITEAGEQYVVMDAPPGEHDIARFVEMARYLDGIGVLVPHINEVDAAQGFACMSDFGTTRYYDVLGERQEAGHWYRRAIDNLCLMQAGYQEQIALPAYSKTILREEMERFRLFTIEQYLQWDMSKVFPAWQDLCEQLVDLADSQPKAYVHLDYHSQNLMVTDDARPGVLDFQDARLGPVAYDLVSLLRDCYIGWRQVDVEAWVKIYWQQAHEQGLPVGESCEQFTLWFDWVGIQRHLKALNLFVLLCVQHDAWDYQPAIPRTMDYLIKVAGRYKPLRMLSQWLETDVQPALQEKMSI